ncbi:MAG: hypothetical protein RMX96_34555 [Nostoc sp. ChiSLP02]|nr:hypothetical protein [Nostoc sp. DedSLP05]MDZ8100744.1 hypothetical protein [Nostoc sp. DedSLP01]MDZ8189945.1 hypothetical protein [Nostoc sp. ChiSLP02]
MRPSVADQTPIPTKVWRRHTDPPGLWISVFIGSVSLHLLVFWLMRSSNTFILWFPQESQSAAIPIELIDIAPKTKSTIQPRSTVKEIAPKRLSSTHKPVASITTQKNQDSSARDSIERVQPKSKTEASTSNSRRFRQRTVVKAIPTPTPTSKPKVTVNNLPWNRRQQLRLGKGTPLTGISSKPPVRQTPLTPTGQTPPTPTGQTRPTPAGQTPQTPTGQTRPTPTGQTRPTPAQTPQTPTGQTRPTPTQTPQTPTGQTRPTPTGQTRPTPAQTPQTPTEQTRPTPAQTPQTPTQGASIAIVAPLTQDEVSSLIKAGELRQDGLPDAIAVYRGSSTKQFDSSFLPPNYGLKPAQLLASLVIDGNGNFQQAVVLEIQPPTLQSEKSTYQQVLNEIFKTENFVPAQNNDGTKPDLSNLYIRIKIQSANSN